MDQKRRFNTAVSFFFHGQRQINILWLILMIISLTLMEDKEIEKKRDKAVLSWKVCKAFRGDLCCLFKLNKHTEDKINEDEVMTF